MKRMAVVVLLLASRLAAAQPGQAPPPAGPPPSGVVTEDQMHFDAGYQAMVRGDYVTARSELNQTLAITQNPDLRRKAEDMLRLTGDLEARQGQGQGQGPMMPPPPGAPVQVVNEEDQRTGGRASFVSTTSVASLYSGIVLTDLLDAGDARTGTMITLGTLAVGTFASLYGTADRRMTGAMADAWALGMAAGVGNSLLLSGPLGIYESDTNTSEKVQSFVLASAWGGAAAGLIIADSVDPTRAQVNVTGTITTLSLVSTLLGFAIVQPDNLSGNAALGITATGLDVGLAAGAYFSRDIDWSLSRARYVGLASFLGGVTGVGVSILFASDDGDDNTLRLAAGITLAGMWGGFAMGANLTKDMAPDLRFQRRQTGPTITMTPTVVPHGAGLGLAGSF